MPPGKRNGLERICQTADGDLPAVRFRANECIAHAHRESADAPNTLSHKNTMEELLTVATFNDQEPAEALAERLRNKGIEANVLDESSAQKWLLMNMTPRAHLRVRVPKAASAAALALLQQWEAEGGAMSQAVRCPQCASSRVEFPQFSRGTMLSALPALVAAAGIIEKTYFCESCGYTWPAVEADVQQLDALNWPIGTIVP